MRRLALVALALFLAAALSAAAQTTGSSGTGGASAGTSASGSGGAASSASGSSGGSSGSGSGSSAGQGPQPVPYSPDEFPLWARKARRAEVIWIGAFPITLLFSRLGYQLFRYYSHGQEQAYAPSIFGTPATPLTQDERIGVVIGGIGLAGLVALADFIVGQIQNPREP